MKKVCSLVLAVCLVFGCFACQNQQEEVYSSALAGAQGDSSAEAEASSQPRGKGRRSLGSAERGSSPSPCPASLWNNGPTALWMPTLG